MSMFNIVTDDAVNIGAACPLSDSQAALLGDLLRQPGRPASSTLGGRRAVRFARLEGIGNVAIKYYTRGGIIRYFVKERYIRWGPTRSEKEFELLQTVRSLGINAPKPIAYAHQGHPFYRAWLVTRAVERHQTLAQLSCADESAAKQRMAAVCSQVRTLIHHGILHVDLHPGNILVNPEGRVFLIDFDKARLHNNSQGLKEKYLHRWGRAVDKHALPPFLHQKLAEGIGETTNPPD